MPISITLDLEYEVAIAVCSGEIPIQEIAEAWRVAAGSPGYRPGFNRFLDCRAVTRLPSAAEARQFADVVRGISDLEHPIRRAYLMLPGAPYGVARMIETMASKDADLITVFTDERAARAWVGLPPVRTVRRSA